MRRLGFARLKDYISEQPRRIARLRGGCGIRHALSGRFILDEGFEVVGELGALDVGIGHEEGRARLHACAGVHGLMVFGGIRERHEQRRDMACRDLGERRGARTADDGVGGRHGKAHLVGVAHEVPALRLLIGQGQLLGDAIELLGARDVHDMQVGVAKQHALALHDGRVEMAGAQASPCDEKHARVLGDAESGTALGARCGEHACAHGVAGEHDIAFVGERLGGVVIGQAHGAGPTSQVLVRHAHDRVLLVDHHGDAALLGGAGHRDADVAAEAHHAVGMDLGKPRARQLRGTLDGMDTTVITELAEYYEKEIGYQIPPRTPFVGKNFNVTRAGIHADGLLKNEEIYNVFDTGKFLNRPPLVAVSNTSGLAGIAHWINTYYHLKNEKQVDKNSILVVELKKWVDAEYESGRVTVLTDEELIREIERICGEKGITI